MKLYPVAKTNLEAYNWKKPLTMPIHGLAFLINILQS